jgi:hypothetical protein
MYSILWHLTSYKKRAERFSVFARLGMLIPSPASTIAAVIVSMVIRAIVIAPR